MNPCACAGAPRIAATAAASTTAARTIRRAVVVGRGREGCLAAVGGVGRGGGRGAVAARCEGGRRGGGGGSDGDERGARHCAGTIHGERAAGSSSDAVLLGVCLLRECARRLG